MDDKYAKIYRKSRADAFFYLFISSFSPIILARHVRLTFLSMWQAFCDQTSPFPAMKYLNQVLLHDVLGSNLSTLIH